MKTQYITMLILFLFSLAGISQNNNTYHTLVEEQEWLGFATTIYLDTNNAIEHIDNDIFVKFAISSEELNASELQRRLGALKIWSLVEYGTEGNLLVVKMKASKADHKTNKLYLLKKMRCIKTIVNGSPMDIEKVKKKINS
jgi:hypothetical protein